MEYLFDTLSNINLRTSLTVWVGKPCPFAS
jgi:hypothetical protein